MAETITYTGNLIVEACWCGIQHAIPGTLRQRAKDDTSFGIYCPLGHQWVFARSEATAQRERADRFERDLASAREDTRVAKIEAQQARHRERAQKAAKTRLKNRVAAGVCPCCTRSFQNLARHMAGQHPDWSNGEA